MSLDASVGGIRLQGMNRVDEGAEISILYDLHDDHFVEGRGTIKWCRERSGLFEVGIALSGFSTSSDAGIAEYLISGENSGLADRGEKRTHPRYHHAAKIYTGGYEADLFDLSEDGCGLFAELEMEPGSFIALVFAAGEDLLKAHGRIKWRKPAEAAKGHVYGVEFWHINTQSRAPYQKFIKRA